LLRYVNMTQLERESASKQSKNRRGACSVAARTFSSREASLQPRTMGRCTRTRTYVELCRTSNPRVICSEQPVALVQLRNKVPAGYNGTPQIHPRNCPFPSTITTPHLIHRSLDRPDSPPQTASGSNLPFYHNTFSGQTDGHTD